MDGANDVIVALATPPGRGGVGILRISGPDLSQFVTSLLGSGVSLVPRHAHYLPFLASDGCRIDQGLAIRFPAPDSFTGEEVLELQGHGGMVLMDMLLERVVELGARLANPGEFTERAFLNGKMDLVQAEAIADLIDSSSRAAARSALHSMQGEFSSRVDELAGQMVELRCWIEAEMDFSDQEIDFLDGSVIAGKIRSVHRALEALVRNAEQGRVLNEGLRVVIAGKPNAGKSSLLNRLAGMESAIVTDIPGTTRDVLRERIIVDGMPVHVLDTAGLRQTDDPIEREGVRRSHTEMRNADRIFLLADAEYFRPEELPNPETYVQDSALPLHDLPPVTLILNKIDLTPMSPGKQGDGKIPVYALSAKTGEGLDQLREHIKECAGFDAGNDGGFIARRRHVEAMRAASSHLDDALRRCESEPAPELLAEDLRLAHEQLGEITGKIFADDLLGKIFGSFCIGK